MPIKSAKRKEAKGWFQNWENEKHCRFKKARQDSARENKQVRMSKRDRGEWIDLLKLELGGKNTHISREGERLTGSGKWAKKNHTRADAQPALAVSVPTGCIHLTSSTSESSRPRAQHLVISEIRSQPRQCWSNQTHLCTNGSLFTAYSQWATVPSVHVYTVNARDTPAAPVLTLWECMSPSVSCNKHVQNLWLYHFSADWRRYPDSVCAKMLWIYTLEQR